MDSPAFTFDLSYKLKDDSTHSTKVSLYVYTEKSLVIKTDESFGKSFAENLKESGGKYNPKLRVGIDKGWVFPNSRKPELDEVLTKINSGEIIGEVVKIYTKKETKTDGLLGGMPVEPPIITKFKMLVSQLMGSNGSNTYKETEKTYFYGTKDEVMAFLLTSPKTIIAEISTPSHRLIVIQN
jgi:hypothetical protein